MPPTSVGRTTAAADLAGLGASVALLGLVECPVLDERPGFPRRREGGETGVAERREHPGIVVDDDGDPAFPCQLAHHMELDLGSGPAIAVTTHHQAVTVIDTVAAEPGPGSPPQTLGGGR